MERDTSPLMRFPCLDNVDIVRLEPGQESRVIDATELFDHNPIPRSIERFLKEPTHHMLIAYADDMPAGYITGVEMTHPDKGTEMFLYELSVHEAQRKRGIGSALVNSLASLARLRGCYGMWVLAEDDNLAGLNTYSKTGGQREETDQVMFTWTFGDDRRG